MPKLETLMQQHAEWAKETFPESTPLSSILGAKREIKELLAELGYIELPNGKLAEVMDHQIDMEKLATEYVDVIKYFFDSMARSGVTIDVFRATFEKKLAINKKRTWVKNADNSYSHVK